MKEQLDITEIDESKKQVALAVLNMVCSRIIRIKNEGPQNKVDNDMKSILDQVDEETESKKVDLCQIAINDLDEEDGYLIFFSYDSGQGVPLFIVVVSDTDKFTFESRKEMRLLFLVGNLFELTDINDVAGDKINLEDDDYISIVNALVDAGRELYLEDEKSGKSKRPFMRRSEFWERMSRGKVR